MADYGRGMSRSLRTLLSDLLFAAMLASIGVVQVRPTPVSAGLALGFAVAIAAEAVQGYYRA